MSHHRQTPEDRIVNYFLDTIERNQGPIYDALYNRFFSGNNQINSRNVDPLYDKAGRMLDLYLDEYRDRSEEECIRMVEEDFEGFFWAQVADDLERQGRISVQDADFNEVDRLLKDSKWVSDQMARMGNRRQSGRNNSSNGGYYHQNSSGRSSRHGRQGNGYTHSAYSQQGNQQQSYGNESGGFTYQSRAPRPQQQQTGSSAYAHHAPPPSNQQNNPPTESWETAPSQTTTVVNNPAPERGNYQPGGSTRRRGDQPQTQQSQQVQSEPTKYITDLNSVRNLKIHPRQGVLYVVDPFTQRLRLSIVDGYVWQEILEVAEMSIDDHLTVIKPERVAVRSNLSSPLVIFSEEDVNVRERSELGIRFQAVMDQWKTEGKLKTDETSWLRLSTDQKNAIAAEATRLMVEEMRIKEEAKKAELIREFGNASSKLKQANQRLDIEEEETTETVIMTIENQKEPKYIKGYEEAFDAAITTATDDANEKGIRLPFKHLSIDYATTKTEDIEFLKTVFEGSHVKSGSVTEIFNRFLKESQGAVPTDLKLLMERRMTKLTNRLLALLGIDIRIGGFGEDFRALMTELDRVQNAGIITNSQVELFLQLLRNQSCVHVKPNMDTLKEVFKELSEEQLTIQQGRSFYKYESGTFVYIHLTTNELNLKPEDMFVSVGNQRVKQLFENVEPHGGKIILATKDRIFYEVYRDDTRQGYILRVLDL